MRSQQYSCPITQAKLTQTKEVGAARKDPKREEKYLRLHRGNSRTRGNGEAQRDLEKRKELVKTSPDVPPLT